MAKKRTIVALCSVQRGTSLVEAILTTFSENCQKIEKGVGYTHLNRLFYTVAANATSAFETRSINVNLS